MTVPSLVLAHPAAPASEAAAYLRAKLVFYTDAADLAHDLAHGVSAVVVVDARAGAAYRDGHIPGAIGFPHRTMDAASTAALARDVTYVVYCDGIGCNASTQGAWKLAALGFSVKELIGGLDFWRRDGHPTVQGDLPGTLAADGAMCGC